MILSMEQSADGIKVMLLLVYLDLPYYGFLPTDITRIAAETHKPH